jgi:rhamnopyranosyl-N-acetylglucosaminyl-diphospho-decaprenol beta-1,3/1,4-galactofuranosyltransferase
MNDKVCAVVVTYNRKNLLIECLESLRKQSRPIQGIYLIDNASSDGTPELLLEKGYLRELPPKNLNGPWEKEFTIQNLTDEKEIKLHYVKMHENTGGAGGFYEGVKRGYEKGYDWLWLMDDDGIPITTTLEKLLYNKNQADVLNSLVLLNGTNNLSFGIYYNKKIIYNFLEICATKKKLIFNTANFYNSTLISKNIIKKVGYPNKNLFIWGDEMEYFIRIMKYGGKVATVTDSFFYHPKGLGIRKKIMGLEVPVLSNKLKLYCFIRNEAYIGKKYSFKSLIKLFISYMFFYISNLKFYEFFFFLSAFVDGIFERWGKEKKYL